MDTTKRLKQSLKLLCDLQDQFEILNPQHYYSSNLIAKINDFYKVVEEEGIELDRLEDFEKID